MSLRWIAAAVLLGAGVSAFAHRVDEYLQASILSLEKDRVGVQLRLTPGIAIYPAVLANIDTDADGAISDAEQSAYLEKVRRDLSLAIDAVPLPLTVDSAKFPRMQDMREGLGEIQIEMHAALPSGGPNRKIVFKNHHQSLISAYLVNTLVPRDPAIRIAAQTRNVNQSVYELNYVQNGAAWWSGERIFIAAVMLLLLARLAWLWRSRHLAVRA